MGTIRIDVSVPGIGWSYAAKAVDAGGAAGPLAGLAPVAVPGVWFVGPHASVAKVTDTEKAATATLLRFIANPLSE
ncbi:MAG TPA: hypothetical protein VF796_17005 [Humisphaera sp.]